MRIECINPYMYPTNSFRSMVTVRRLNSPFLTRPPSKGRGDGRGYNGGQARMGVYCGALQYALPFCHVLPCYRIIKYNIEGRGTVRPLQAMHSAQCVIAVV
jgi:hypothetical protein